MKFTYIIIFISSLYVFFGILSSQIRFDSGEPSRKISVFHDYSGVMNVHSKKSIGSGSVQQIISAANKSGLDFIFFNEAPELNQKQPEPITFGNLNVFYGWELPYKNSKFLVGEHSSPLVISSPSETEIFISNSLETESDQLLVMAHPDKEDYAWNGPLPKNLSGVEVVNLREIWNQAWKKNKSLFVFSLLFYPFNPEMFFLEIFSSSSTSEDSWQGHLNQGVKASGFLGTEATSKLRISKSFFLRFPSYETLFSLSKNHILLREELTGSGNHRKILSALKKGNSYFSLDVLGNPRGFLFYGMSDKKKYINMGESMSFSPDSHLVVEIPKTQIAFKITLFKDGKVLKEFKDYSVNYPLLETGTYRVKVELNPRNPFVRRTNWLPWIYSNPIYVEQANAEVPSNIEN